MTTLIPTVPPAHRPRLGEALRLFGVLSEPEIEGAMRRQALEGGRLGTCLLDSGRVDEATLLAALGAQGGFETVGGDVLDALPLEAAGWLPARAALQAQAVPLRRDERELEVAMMDPGSLLRVDELAAVSRRRIVPRLALEVRIAEALERLYGAAVSPRLAWTRSRIDRRRAMASLE